MREIIRAGEFAGGVPIEGQFNLRRGNAGTVVADANELSAAIARFDRDVRCVRVERVLDQFFHRRGGPLDDFTGGNL